MMLGSESQVREGQPAPGLEGGAPFGPIDYSRDSGWFGEVDDIGVFDPSWQRQLGGAFGSPGPPKRVVDQIGWSFVCG